MKRRVSLLIILLMAIAFSNTKGVEPVVKDIVIVEFGIYAQQNVIRCASSVSPSGFAKISDNVQLTQMTTNVPAMLNMRFGFEYIVMGTPTNDTVNITIVKRFPEPGICQPGQQKTVREARWDRIVKIGEKTGDGYGFDNSWEVIPGIWTFEIWYRGVKFAEKTFNVYLTNSITNDNSKVLHANSLPENKAKPVGSNNSSNVK